ncbi:hypothetical protein Ancab_038626, partial [Ancistrocladus abbreviatus]
IRFKKLCRGVLTVQEHIKKKRHGGSGSQHESQRVSEKDEDPAIALLLNLDRRAEDPGFKS